MKVSIFEEASVAVSEQEKNESISRREVQAKERNDIHSDSSGARSHT